MIASSSALIPRWRTECRDELEALARKGLRRTLEPLESPNGVRVRLNGVEYLNFSSNDYLGLAGDARVIGAAQEALARWGAGSGASRLLSGNLGIHESLEREIAAFKGEASALVFSSGYLTNLGVITAMTGAEDVIVADRLNHASLIDAARLSRAKLWVYPHRDMERLHELLGRARRFRRRLVVTDAYFSMDGTVAPLDRMSAMCREHEAILFADEAHSTGVFGEEGRGLASRFGLTGQIDLVMGTLSKALGSVGGFVCGAEELRSYLIGHARPFVYTTGPSPAASAAALKALRILREDAPRRQRLQENTRAAREGFRSMGLDLGESEGPILPIFVGDSARAVALRQRLRAAGILAPAIRPPTVPKGTDRIRIAVSAAHSSGDIARLLDTFAKEGKKL